MNDDLNSKYMESILKSMDWHQKDYYKECTYVDILLSDSWNNLPILIIFGKTSEELFEKERNDIYAYRTILHYPYCVTLEYPLGITKEDLIYRIQKVIDAACRGRKKTEEKRGLKA